MINYESKNVKRKKRHQRIRNKVSGTSKCPRLNVFRSNTGISVQLIDDVKQVTLATASSKEIKEKGTMIEIAAKVGTLIAEKAKKAKIKDVVFDRGGYQYHGRVKALAEAAREAGLNF